MFELMTIRQHQVDDNPMNQQLRALYADMFTPLSDIITDYNCKNKSLITNPYLLAASHDYYAAKRRVMIFGQETNTWGGEFGNDGVFNPDTSVEELMNLYDLFAYTGYNSPFWNYCKVLKSAGSKQGVSFIYNNLMKLGLVGATGYNPDIAPKFNPLLAEIEILKPDLLIFLSGPNYDFRIRTQISDFSMQQVLEQYPIRKFAKLKFTNETLPEAYRTYHPNYLRFSPDYFVEVQKTLIKNI